ncbi:hypothetical protein [Peribacillus frigoritolerans]|uniref:hypothetical protein n=1 Tax=Peribacillus frigoritolerans TaxID=450367 RepID=UPI003B8B7EF8
MKNNKLYQVIIAIFIFVLMVDHSVYAMEWEDEEGPISFKIEMLPWEIVNNIIPDKTNFTIIDIETGLSFKVTKSRQPSCRCTAINQRRYSNHEENL